MNTRSIERFPMTFPHSKNFIIKDYNRISLFCIKWNECKPITTTTTANAMKKDKNNEPPRYARCQSDFELILFISVCAFECMSSFAFVYVRTVLSLNIKASASVQSSYGHWKYALIKLCDMYEYIGPICMHVCVCVCSVYSIQCTYMSRCMHVGVVFLIRVWYAFPLPLS